MKPDYPSPRWGRLYAKYFPKYTCPTSRHARLIAQGLRQKRSPIRRLLEEAGYETDHMASAIEQTVVMLWKARKKLANRE